jgi:hypothetical protein
MQPTDIEKSKTGILPESSGLRVTIDYKRRKVGVYSLFESEIRGIGSFQNSVNLAFFMLAVGLVVGFGTVLLTSHSSLSDRMFTVFCGLTLSSLVAMVYFGVKAWLDRRECERKIQEVLQTENEPKSVS